MREGKMEQRENRQPTKEMVRADNIVQGADRWELSLA